MATLIATMPMIEAMTQAQATQATTKLTIVSAAPSPPLPSPATSPVPSTRPRCTAISRYDGVCDNTVRWKIDSGYYCHKHAEIFWETHFVEDHEVIRLMKENWPKPTETSMTSISALPAPEPDPIEFIDLREVPSEITFAVLHARM